MRFKKILAGLLAGTMAVTSAAITVNAGTEDSSPFPFETGDDWKNSLSLSIDDLGVDLDRADKTNLMFCYLSTKTTEWGSQYKLCNSSWEEIVAATNLKIASQPSYFMTPFTDQMKNGIIVQGFNLTLNDVFPAYKIGSLEFTLEAENWGPSAELKKQDILANAEYVVLNYKSYAEKNAEGKDNYSKIQFCNTQGANWVTICDADLICTAEPTCKVFSADWFLNTVFKDVDSVMVQGYNTNILSIDFYSSSIPATDIELDNTKLSINKGESETLTASLTPTDTTDKVVWSSRDDGIATVDQTGKVTAVEAGSTTITATAGAVSATCEVTVNIPVTGITLDQDTLFLLTGDTVTLKETVTPGNATDKTVTWETDNNKVATVDGGKVTAVAKGTATITAKAGEKTATCKVTVADPAKTITLDDITVLVGADKDITYKVDPEGAEISNISYVSSNEEIFTVADGKVHGVGEGTAKLTMTAANAGNTKLTAECTVTVSAKKIPAESVTIDKTTLDLEVEGTAALKATVTPADSTDNVVWSSSNEDIAKVDQTGKVTAVAVGTADITATAGEKTATCKVTVTAKTIAITEVILDKTATVEEGATVQLTATVKPDDATEDKTVTWKSSDETIATVDSTGKVTGVKAGKATITATAGEKSAECAVTVTAKPEETQPTEPDNPTPGDTITVYELNADELKLLSDPKTTFTISYNSPNGWNDIGFGASLPDESWASASLPAKQGDGTLKVTVEDLIKSMKVKEEGDVTTLDGVTYCKVEGYNGTVFYSVKVEIPTEPDEPDKPIEGMTANLKLYTQGNDGAGWAWKDFGDDSIKTVTVSDDSEAVELKWTIAVDEKVDSADKFSAGGLQIAFDDPDCAYVGQKVNIYITEITLGGEKKDDITKEETSIVANWNNTGSEIMVNLSDISFENVGKEYSCKVKITPVSKAPDQPDQPGEDDTTTTTKAPTGFYTPDESTTTTPSDTTTAPDSGSTPATADTTELTNDDNGVKVEFAAGTVKEGAVLNVNKSGETATSATFDITLNLNGAAIQPDGTLTITINIPAGLAGAANYYVYRVETDGTYTDMLATLADGKLTFKTGHLSEYVISTVKLTDTGVVNGDDSSTASSAPVEDNGANTGNADNEPAGDNGGNGNTGSTGGNTDDKNVATGIVIAFIPAAAAAAAVVISKKRK